MLFVVVCGLLWGVGLLVVDGRAGVTLVVVGCWRCCWLRVGGGCWLNWLMNICIRLVVGRWSSVGLGFFSGVVFLVVFIGGVGGGLIFHLVVFSFIGVAFISLLILTVVLGCC